MTTTQENRPLSPHLQVYKPQITSFMSITHRATGVALSLGVLVLVAWLWAAAYDADYFTMWNDFFSGILGKIFLIGWTVAFYYHLGNGIRHLFWDAGKGFELTTVTRSGVTVLLFTAVATLASWAMIIDKVGF